MESSRPLPILLALAAFAGFVAGCSPKSPAPDAEPVPAPDAAPVRASAEPVEVANDESPSPLADIRSWALYYGPAAPDLADRLGGYDLVVVAPHALGDDSVETVAALKARGCLVAGYLSCFEIASWQTYADRVKPEWLVKVDGEIWHPFEDNTAASLANEEWRALLVELAKTQVFDVGCDGLFMDTIADLDSDKIPDEGLRLRELDGLGKLVAALNETYPDAFLIANRTLQRTLPALSSHIDAVCWTDFAPKYFDDFSVRNWMRGIAKGLALRQETHKFRVLSLWNESQPGDDIAERQERMRRISAEYGYLPYCTVGGYKKLPPPAPAE